MHTAPYFTAFGLLTVFHGLRVIRLRFKHRVSLGDGGVPELERLIRVFGNHSEYVPIGLLLLIALEFLQAPPLYMHLCGLCLLSGRISHAIGLARSGKRTKPRFFGMVLTFLSLLLSSIGIMVFSFLAPA